MNYMTCVQVLAASVLGCVLASGTSFRSLISATTFALTGNVCKAISAAASLFIWEFKLDFVQWLGLCTAVLSGSCFRGAGEGNATLLKDYATLLAFMTSITLLYVLCKGQTSLSLSRPSDSGVKDCSIVQHVSGQLC